MKLKTHKGVVADPATADVLARVVAGLTEVGKAYVILNDDDVDETYVQAAGTVGEEFLVEYRDGRAGEHYRCDRRLSVEDLVALLAGYLGRAPDWRSAFTWHRVRVDQPPLTA